MPGPVPFSEKRSSPTRGIGLQLPAQNQMTPLTHLVQQSMETGTMIFMSSMAQLVQNDVIDQRIRQFHQMQAQRNIIVHRTTAPTSPGIANRHPAATQSGLSGKFRHPTRQIRLGFDPPSLFDAATNGLLHPIVLRRQFRRITDADTSIGHPNTHFRSGNGLQRQTMGSGRIRRNDQLRTTPFSHPCTCPQHPIPLLFQKTQRLLSTHPTRNGQTHLTSRPHTD